METRFTIKILSQSIRLFLFFSISMAGQWGTDLWGQDLKLTAKEKLKKAVEFFRNEVALNGGYVYFYSEDLSQRWGEGKATTTQIWVQPPGTPRVGEAYLSAFEATGDKYYLRTATETAEGLIFGQLKSGGWSHAIDFDPKGKRSGHYRNGKGKGRNFSTLDDDVSQAALRFLMRLDQAYEFKNASIHESVQIGLTALLGAQFPNGGFPQVWEAPVEAHPILNASYPDYNWKTDKRIKEYWHLYTLNDNLAGDVAETLIQAHQIYNQVRFLEALKRLGNFLILAQMPDPQPAWCQQYTFEMKPAWARKFEPPAIVSSESMDVMRALILIYKATGDLKYLKPIPKALEYFEKSLLADGRLPRYFELRTNKPLYMERIGNVYNLTYSDDNLPSHYAFKVSPRLGRLQKEFQQAQEIQENPKQTEKKVSSDMVESILEKLDGRGRWINTYAGKKMSGQPEFEIGFTFLSSAEFANNVEILSRFISQ